MQSRFGGVSDKQDTRSLSECALGGKETEMAAEENENNSIRGEKPVRKTFVTHGEEDSQSQTCGELSQWRN